MNCGCRLTSLPSVLIHPICNAKLMPQRTMPMSPTELAVSLEPQWCWGAPRWVPTARHARMAYQRLGAVNGPVWLVLHGGPGSGANPGLVAPFNLKEHQVIVPDQRGAGSSRPRGRTAGNHTDQLVADLEVLRQHLGLTRWHVLAGSWGTVLALRYAQCHPNRVGRLVLRGAFALRWSEIRGVLQPHPVRDRAVWADPHWPRAVHASGPTTLVHVARLLQFATLCVATLHVVRCWNLMEQRAALRGLWRSLVHASGCDPSSSESDPTACRQAWAQLRRRHRLSLGKLQRPGWGRDDRRGLQKFRLQAHYLRHRGFMRPGALDGAVRSLARHATPTDWVHGRFDAICPPGNSRRWLSQSDAVARGVAQGHWPDAGHLASEPAMQLALAGVVRLEPVRR